MNLLVARVIVCGKVGTVYADIGVIVAMGVGSVVAVEVSK